MKRGRSEAFALFETPTDADLAREGQVLELLQERFDDWQRKGHIPSRRIEPGAKTDEPIRTRGWTHWHHLFMPRQLLVNGFLAEKSAGSNFVENLQVALMLGVGTLCGLEHAALPVGLECGQREINPDLRTRL